MIQDKNKELGFETQLIHGGQGERDSSGALSFNICQTATFKYETVEAFEKSKGYNKTGNKPYIYTRSANPSVEELEKSVALLEGGESAVATASGIAAINSSLLTLLNSGDHIIAANGIYFSTGIFINETLLSKGIESTFVDATNLDEIKNAIKENTKVIFVESSLNPSTRIVDIEKCAKIAHENNILLVVDGTFTPPPIMSPLKLGADILVHSLTKYYNGHGDALGGIIVGSNNIIENMLRTTGVANSTGAAISPMNAWLIRRGMKTMNLRMKKHCSNALRIAEFLENHPKVEYVMYPALKSHPEYDLCMNKMNGMGSGIVSFKLKDNINGLACHESGTKFINHLSLFSVAVSFGEADSLIFMKDKPDLGLIRIAVGLEDIDDLLIDIEKGLTQI
jgi:methionine-gamma-lyase